MSDLGCGNTLKINAADFPQIDYYAFDFTKFTLSPRERQQIKRLQRYSAKATTRPSTFLQRAFSGRNGAKPLIESVRVKLLLTDEEITRSLSVEGRGRRRRRSSCD